ncbi:nitrogen regulatory protein P-II family [Algoriphagus ornithinivorans]|jgi:nitrogen regulatory protein P-II 1|uniref:Nitrogen regulatory protein P-II family n=2 Tax=Cyclobacteriaceae TaxID=563798 RepID=A0A1I5FTP9_9BACT|nr:nitrogen regulatory protein P-II family [Algoriphagus ornithinivorans]|tara:strand:- start:713 stop:1090 length:378 start_codon:yes stop_codon:yes gene_type:complete
MPNSQQTFKLIEKMKKIEAIIRTSRFEQIHACISGLGVKFLSFYEIKGMGFEHARQEMYRGVAYEPAYIPRTKLEIVTTDDLVESVIQCILKEGKTGEIGDGKIFVFDVLEAYRIRNNDQGEKAL